MADVILRLKIDDKEFDAKVISADNKLKKLHDDANFSKIGQSLSGLVTTLGIGLSAAAVINFGKESVKAFSESEDAANRLKTALGHTSQSLIDDAAALQRVTAQEDDSIIAAESLIAAHIKNEDQIKKVMRATLDFAVAKRIDLNSAADLVTKTISTETNALMRQGIEVKGAAGSVDRLNSAVTNITALYGGQAKAELDTYAGQVKNLQNRMGDLQEEIGGELVVALVALGDVITDNLGEVEKSSDSFTVLGGIIKTAASAAMILWAELKAIGNVAGTVGAVMYSLAKLDFKGAVNISKAGLQKTLDDIWNSGKSIVNMWETVNQSTDKSVIRNVKTIIGGNKASTISELETLQIRRGLNEITQKEYIEALQNRIAKLKANTIEEKKILLETVNELNSFYKRDDKQKQAKASPEAAAPDVGESMAQLRVDAMEEGIDKERAQLNVWYKEQMDMYEGNIDKQMLIYAQGLQKNKALNEKKAKADMALQNQFLDDLSGNLGKMFGQTKEVAIAQSLINTYQAVTKANSAYPPPWNIPAMVLAAAAGMAEVAKIEKTKIKGYAQGGGVMVGEKGPEIIAPVDSFAEASRMLVAKSIEAVQNSLRNVNARGFANNSGNMDTLVKAFNDHTREIRDWQRELTFKFRGGEFVTGSNKAQARYNALKF